MEIMKKSTKKFKEVRNCNQKAIKKTKEGGITLIALIVTIIILLILAGITIATLTGENGIITNAIQARNEYADGAVAEGFSLLWNEYQIEIRVPTGDNTKGITEGTKVASTEDVKIQGDIKEYLATTETSFWDFLIGKNVINDNGVVNIENLIGGTLSRGNGTEETGDIYQLEESSGTYIVKYHEESSDEGYAIWQVSTTGESAGETIDWDKIFAEAKPAEGQSESNTAIGIGPRGEPVNMDYWYSICITDENENRYISLSRGEIRVISRRY